MSVAWKNRFSTKIMLFTAAFALVAAVLISAAIYLSFSRLIERQVIERISSSAQIVSDQIAQLGMGYEKDLTLIGANPAVAMALSSGTPLALDDHSGFHALFLINPQGETLWRSSHDPAYFAPDAGALAQLLDNARQADDRQIVASAFFADEEARTSDGARGADKLLGLRIEDANGDFLGLLGAQIEGGDLQAILEQDLGLETNVQAFFADQSHNIILGANLIEDDLLRGEAEAHSVPFIDAAIRSGVSSAEVSNEGDSGKFIEAYAPVEFLGSQLALGFDLDYSVVTRTALSALLAPALIISLASGLFILCFVYMIRNISRPLDQMQTDFRKIAESRDFRMRLHDGRKDEIGQSTRAVDEILDVVEQLLLTSEAEAAHILQQSEAMHGESLGMTGDAEVQSGSVEKLSASINESETRIAAVTQRLSDAVEKITASEAAAREGKDSVQRLTTSMDEIDQVSEDIEKIIGVIHGIAFQTNILSLNASVEAARAGAEGKGFAAVATEVGHLARRAADAARESEALIDKAKRRIVKGVETSHETSRLFLDIMSDVQQVSEHMREIKGTTQSQAAELKSINRAAEDLAVSAISALHRGERLVSTARELEDTSRRVRSSLDLFQFSATHSAIARAANSADRPKLAAE